MAKPSWIDAMQEEIHEFKRLQVWELVPCPDKVMLIKLKWIYKVKTDEFSGVLKNKARLDNPSHVYKLKKALYSLKQAPRAWYDMLSSFLISLKVIRYVLEIVGINHYNLDKLPPRRFRTDSESQFSYMEDDVDISTLTIEQYIALISDNIKPGIVNPKIGDDVEFKINANFMRELRRKLFACTDDEDAYEHVRKPHSHDWYDETTTRERINDVLDNVDAIHESFKGEHLTNEYPLKKEDETFKHSEYMKSLEETIIKFCEDTIKKQTADDEKMRKILENTESNIRALKTRTKNLQEKVYQLTHKVLTNTGEKVKAIMTMDKENMKEPVPCDLPPTPFLETLKKQMGSPYRTHETIRMIGNPKEIHNEKAQEDERNMDIVHITPPGDDHVAPVTNPMSNKQLNNFEEEFPNITKVVKKEHDNPVIKTYDYETFIQKLLHQVSQSSREMKSQ
ncbi:hypothetical protein Tco_1228053 [Tanacetum coccineum]